MAISLKFICCIWYSSVILCKMGESFASSVELNEVEVDEPKWGHSRESVAMKSVEDLKSDELNGELRGQSCGRHRCGKHRECVRKCRYECVPSRASDFTSFQNAASVLQNKYRADHGAAPLTMTDALNSAATECAKKYAAGSIQSHKCFPDSGSTLDNIYTSSQQFADNGEAFKAAINSWYKEVAFYDYNNPGVPTKAGEQTGHFTEMVWKATKKFGIGIATMPTCTFSGQEYTKCTKIVGAYDPTGNIHNSGGDEYGQYKINVGRKIN